MKKILCSLLILLSTIGCFAGPEYFDWVYATNIVVWTPSQVLSNHIYPGAMDISRPAAPFISFYQSGIGGTPAVSETLYMEHVFRDAAFHGRFRASDDFRIDGNLTVLGTITTATNILNVTNVFSTTNSFYYPTNSATAAVNLGTTYGDLQVDGSAPVAFSIDNTSVVPDVYQTAVVIVRNTSGVATNITAAGMKVQGTPWVTNRTVCTFFHHNLTGDTFTNMTVLPLW